MGTPLFIIHGFLFFDQTRMRFRGLYTLQVELGFSLNVSIFNLNQYCKLHIEVLHPLHDTL